jgi:hypothetical protein
MHDLQKMKFFYQFFLLILSIHLACLPKLEKLPTDLFFLQGVIAGSSPPEENPPISDEPDSICDLSHFELIQPSNSEKLFTYLREQASLGSSGLPEKLTTTIPVTFSGGAGLLKWRGGVLATNGKIYGIPGQDTQILVIDPTNDTVSYIDTMIAGTNKWTGGVLAPNGKIYATPDNDDRILKIDPDLNTFSFINSGFTGSGKWQSSGVVAPNGKIYFLPSNQSNILVLDPTTDTLTTIPGLGLSPQKWRSTTLIRNGKIYALPNADTNLLVLDPTTNTFTLIPGPIPGPSNKYIGAIIAPNEKIYGVPTIETRVMIVDTIPATPTFDITSITGLTVLDKFNGGVLAPNGKVFMIPATNSPAMLVVDSKDNSWDLTSLVGFSPNTSRGAVLAPNGKIYTIPYADTFVTIIDPMANGSFCPSVLQSTYFNKF